MHFGGVGFASSAISWVVGGIIKAETRMGPDDDRSPVQVGELTCLLAEYADQLERCLHRPPSAGQRAYRSDTVDVEVGPNTPAGHYHVVVERVSQVVHDWSDPVRVRLNGEPLEGPGPVLTHRATGLRIRAHRVGSVVIVAAADPERNQAKIRTLARTHNQVVAQLTSLAHDPRSLPDLLSQVAKDLDRWRLTIANAGFASADLTLRPDGRMAVSAGPLRGAVEAARAAVAA